MGTVSNLTAGIAHDFNNLLAGIQGNAELLKLEGRGAKLTFSLLTFASKRNLTPRTLRIDESLSLSSGVLQQTLGPDVRVETHLARDLWPVRVNPALVEHVVLNLAVSARDAMPSCGVFRISAGNCV